MVRSVVATGGLLLVIVYSKSALVFFISHLFGESIMKKQNEELRLENFAILSEQFSLIPLNGKVPIEKGWSKWCTEKRPFDDDDFHGKNAGICCGPVSNIIVVDVDDRKLFHKFRKQHAWKSPPTYKVIWLYTILS